MFVSSRPPQKQNNKELKQNNEELKQEPWVLMGTFIVKNKKWNVVVSQESLYHRIETTQDIFADEDMLIYLCEKWFITQEIYEWILAKNYIFDSNLHVEPLPAVKQQQIEDCFDWSRYETILNANPGASKFN